VVGSLDGGRGLLLLPVGTPLADSRLLEGDPKLSNSIGTMVLALQKAHELGWRRRLTDAL
jgi:hypothetical protein